MGHDGKQPPKRLSEKAKRNRLNEPDAYPLWHRAVDAAAAYTPKGTNLTAGLVALWVVPNKIVGSTILVGAATIESLATLWDRFQKRREKRNADRRTS